MDLGRAYEKNNESDKAIESYTTATQKDSQNAIAFLRLGVLQGRRHSLSEAAAAFDKADTIYQALGNVEGRAEVALQRGVLLNDIAGRVSEARAQLEQARDMAKVVNNTYQQIKILFQLSSVAIKEGQAEQAFQQALEVAQRYGGKQNEARARLSLGSLYIQRGETDRGLTFVDQALAFFQPGAYRTETSQGLLLRARALKQKGDYAAALQSFQDQLKLAEQTGDQSQIANFHGAIGGIMMIQEQYAEARQHFEEGRARYKASGNQLYEGYALMNLGDAFWKLGNYDESRKMLEQASAIANQTSASFVALQAQIALKRAAIAMNDRNFAEAGARAKQALDLAGAEDKAVAAEANSVICLSQALTGRAPAGLALCQQAYEAAATLGDPLLAATSQLELAEAALSAGDAKRAVENARQAQSFFANSAMMERNWRASLIAGMASEKLLDQDNARNYFKQASDAFSSLEQKWGAETFKAYQARPDTQFYRKQLEQSSASLR